MAAIAVSSVLRGLQWSLDRMLAVAYGVLYDYIFERFEPYRQLQREVVDTVAATAGDDRAAVRILDIGCGPGNFALLLAEAGFSVTGVDAYDPLISLAQEKRRARLQSNVAFKHANIVVHNPFPPELFDQVINIHFLYAHAAPDAVLREAFRMLKPGGHGVFVNLTRRVPVWSTVRTLTAREGAGAAARSLLWVLPNAIFELLRRRTGPHYWDEGRMTARLQDAGFRVIELRRTFFDDASLLAVVRKPNAGDGAGTTSQTAGSPSAR